MSLGFTAPATLADLARVMSGPETPWLIAGGTDRLIAPAALPAQGVIVDLSRLAVLTDITHRHDSLILGAGVTVARLASEALVRQLAPVLAQAAAVFGSPQIRNRATIGGNVAHGSAAADLIPALLAAGAMLRLWSPQGEETLPLAALLARRPRLAPQEVILCFEILAAPLGAFVKLGPRQEPVISRLTLAAAGQAGALRLYAGAIGPLPLHLTKAEAILNAAAPGFSEAVGDAVAAANPGRASTAWKARAVRGLAEDLLERLKGAST